MVLLALAAALMGLSAPASAVTLVYDGFESGGLSGWTNSGVTMETAYVYAGSWATNFNSSDNMYRAINTTGYQNVVFTYVRKTRNYDTLIGVDHFKAYYTTNYGQTWVQLEDLTGNHDWTIKQWALPSAANNNSLFGIKFQVVAGSTDHAYVDEVSVTATAIPPPNPATLSVNVVGQGAYSVNPAGPYTVGQNVTITFSPSSGAETVTKPDVAPAAAGDPNAGWIFNHWTKSSTPVDTTVTPYDGLDNPAVITLSLPTNTVYAHFLNTGSTAHPTANQKSQLMDIARGTWSGWDSLTTTQKSQLQVKANHWNDIIQSNHVKWGQLCTVWFKDFERTNEHFYDYLGEGITWSGMYLAGLTLKHSQMPSDQPTLTQMNALLDAMDRNTVIQGAPGYVSRFSGPSSNAIYQAYYQSYGPGAYQGASPYTDYTWLAHPTRDSHTGLFVGLATVLQYCQDTTTVNKAKTIAERVVDRLILDSFWVRDIQGSIELPTANLTQLQKRVAYKANPTKYSSFYSDITGFSHLDMSIKTLYASDYWTAWMTWSQMWGIAMLEWDANRLATYKEDLRSGYGSVYTHMNNLYVTAATSFPSPNLEPWVYATHQGNLLAAADGAKWTWEVNLFDDPRFTDRDSEFVVEAALPNQRAQVDFSPHRSAATALGGYNYYAYSHTNVDLLWSYWAGRVSGAVPAP
jgi:hypothetical protein